MAHVSSTKHTDENDKYALLFLTCLINLDRYWAEWKRGELALTEDDFPSVFFPSGTVYSEPEPDRDFLRSEAFLRVRITLYHSKLIRTQAYNHVMNGSGVAFKEPGKHVTIAEKYNMKGVTGRRVAYVATQVRVLMANTKLIVILVILCSIRRNGMDDSYTCIPPAFVLQQYR